MTTVDVAEQLSDYVAGAAAHAPLPAEVVRKAQLHILDAIGAVISGTALEPGRQGQVYARRQRTTGPASVWNSTLVVPAPVAALSNAMAAHADETDDTHPHSLTHPGCSIVPAACALAEAHGRSGMDLIRAVVVGYDVCGRVTSAVWPDLFDKKAERVHSTHAIGGLFGSAAAAGLLSRFDSDQCRSLWSYTTQQASGIRTYFAEENHVEKAFVFAGMPAYNGVMAADLVAAGWPGGRDPFTGQRHFFQLGPNPNPPALVDGLGERFEVLRTKLKKYPVGSPAQAPVDALLTVLGEHGLTSQDVAAVRVWLAPVRLRTVSQRPIPSVDIEYLLGTVLLDRALTFHAAHDLERLDQWRRAGGDPRIQVLPDERLGTSHAARLQLRTTSGTVIEHEVTAIPGSPEAPLTDAEVEAKAISLVEPELGPERARELIAVVRKLPDLPDVDALVEVLSLRER